MNSEKIKLSSDFTFVYKIMAPIGFSLPFSFMTIGVINNLRSDSHLFLNFYLISIPFFIYAFRTIYLLSVASIEKEYILINKILKSDKIPLSEIIEVKYFWSFRIIKLKEPMIIIKFKNRTKLGKKILILPVSYDNSDLGRKSFSTYKLILEKIKKSNH